jgi:hypothetical protein
MGRRLVIVSGKKSRQRRAGSTGYYARVGVASNLTHAFLAARSGGRIGIRTDQHLVPHAAWTLDDPDLADGQSARAKIIHERCRFVRLPKRGDED